MKTQVPIKRVETSVFTIPTDAPEADGTFKRDHTTMVLVEVHAGGQVGVGYTYANESAAVLIRSSLAAAHRG